MIKINAQNHKNHELQQNIFAAKGGKCIYAYIGVFEAVDDECANKATVTNNKIQENIL